MNESGMTFRKWMLLVAFGVCLSAAVQNIDAVARAVGFVWNVVSPIALGLCIAFVLNVIMTVCERLLASAVAALCKRVGWGRPRPRLLRALALLMTLIVGLGLIAVTVVLIVPKVSEAISMFLSSLPQSSKELSQLLGDFLMKLGIEELSIANLQASITKLSDQIVDFAKEQGGAIAGYALNMTTSLLGTVTDLLFGIIIAIYVLLDKERIGRFCYAVLNRFLPKKVCDRVSELAKLSFRLFSAFVRGQLLEAVILGVLCFVGMVIFRFPYALVVSLLVGVTALIPIVGAWIGGIVSALLVLLVSPIQALLLVIFILVLQQLEGDLIYPRVVGSTIGLPGLLVLSAVVVGQRLMGVAGILLCVPFTAVVYTVLREAVFSPQKPVPEEQQKPAAAEKPVPVKPAPKAKKKK